MWCGWLAGNNTLSDIPQKNSAGLQVLWQWEGPDVGLNTLLSPACCTTFPKYSRLTGGKGDLWIAQKWEIRSAVANPFQLCATHHSAPAQPWCQLPGVTTEPLVICSAWKAEAGLCQHKQNLVPDSSGRGQGGWWALKEGCLEKENMNVSIWYSTPGHSSDSAGSRAVYISLALAYWPPVHLRP